MQQPSLFTPDQVPRPLAMLAAQKDIIYLGTRVRGVLNPPEATGMPFWSINPYVGCAFGCAYCYARYAHRYAMERAADADALDPALRPGAAALPPWLAFERRILVKENAADALRRALRRPTPRQARLLAGDTVLIGTATDPYQPAERRFRLTRGVLEALAEHEKLSVVIITKSPLVTRDVDVLARLARRSRLSVHISLITIDRELARRLEPRAPTPEARLRAIARLREAAIDVGVNVMPVLPGITDNPAALDALVRQVAEAGATHVNACALRLRAAARDRYLPFVAEAFPELEGRYREAYGRGHTVGDRYREGLRTFFERLCRRHGVPFGHTDSGDDEDEAEDAASMPAAAAPDPQLGLAL
ncbi:MAG TPA: radical SAM protein [Gemmatimonadaceae bacterium]|nr:radical SAM protein [Gemmatimonadaceae bacterium]